MNTGKSSGELVEDGDEEKEFFCTKCEDYTKIFDEELEEFENVKIE